MSKQRRLLDLLESSGLMDPLDNQGSCSSCEENHETLKDILECVKNIYELLKRHLEPEDDQLLLQKDSDPVHYTRGSTKKRPASNILPNQTSVKKRLLATTDTERSVFEDVHYLEEDIIIDPVNIQKEIDSGIENYTEPFDLEFPLKTVREVDLLEHHLEDPKSPYRRKIIDLMLGTGFEQKDYKFAIRTFFKVVYEPALMATYCWYGNEHKSSLKNLKYTLEYFESTVRKWAPSWKRQDFPIVVRNYVRNCPARALTIAIKEDKGNKRER